MDQMKKTVKSKSWIMILKLETKHHTLLPSIIRAKYFDCDVMSFKHMFCKAKAWHDQTEKFFQPCVNLIAHLFEENLTRRIRI